MESKINKDFAGALAKFQAECPPVWPDSKGEIKGTSKKTGKEYSYSYNYPSFQALKETARPHLLTNGLSVTQFVHDDKLYTVVLHESSGSIVSTATLPQSQNMSDYASDLSWMCRIIYAKILGITILENDTATVQQMDEIFDLAEEDKYQDLLKYISNNQLTASGAAALIRKLQKKSKGEG